MGVGESRAQMEAAMRTAMQLVGERFLDGLKTETYRAALDTVWDVDNMSDDEFAMLLAQRMSTLDEEERVEAEKTITAKIGRWDNDDVPLSLREEILLDLQAMIRRHEYYAGQKQIDFSKSNDRIK